MTDQLLPNHNDRQKVIQPHFTRNRIAYRSPLSSVETNLEMEQLRFDFTNLHAKLTKLQIDIDETLKGLAEGTTLDAPYSLTSLAISDLLSKVAGYDERLRRLESQRGI